MREPNSLTGAYISGRVQIEMRPERRQKNGAALTILGAKANNLKNLDVTFPLGVMTVVTGVSGSGKSTLVNDILYRALARQLYRSREKSGEHKAIMGAENIDKVIRIDQSPIGARRARIPQPIPECSLRFAISTPCCRKRASAGTSRDVFPSTFLAAAVKLARAKASVASR